MIFANNILKILHVVKTCIIESVTNYYRIFIFTLNTFEEIEVGIKIVSVKKAFFSDMSILHVQTVFY